MIRIDRGINNVATMKNVCTVSRIPTLKAFNNPRREEFPFCHLINDDHDSRLIGSGSSHKWRRFPANLEAGVLKRHSGVA